MNPTGNLQRKVIQTKIILRFINSTTAKFLIWKKKKILFIWQMFFYVNMCKQTVLYKFTFVIRTKYYVSMNFKY